MHLAKNGRKVAVVEKFPRVGGACSFDFGFWSHGIVTAYEPNSRFAYAEFWPTAEHMTTLEHDISTLSPIATEFLIEAASGGTTVLRVVTSSYGTGADWENEFFDEMAKGWLELLDRLGALFAQPRAGVD